MCTSPNDRLSEMDPPAYRPDDSEPVRRSDASDAVSGAASADPERVRRRLRTRRAAIGARELRRALDRLETHGSVTDEQRRVVTELVAAIADGVLSGPDSALSDSGERRADAETARVVADLFDLD